MSFIHCSFIVLAPFCTTFLFVGPVPVWWSPCFVPPGQRYFVYEKSTAHFQHDALINEIGCYSLVLLKLPTLITSLLCGIPIGNGITVQEDVIRGNVAKLPTISHLNFSFHKWAINLFTYAFQFVSPPHQIVFVLFRLNGLLCVKVHQCQRQQSHLRSKRHTPHLFVV